MLLLFNSIPQLHPEYEEYYVLLCRSINAQHKAKTEMGSRLGLESGDNWAGKHFRFRK